MKRVMLEATSQSGGAYSKLYFSHNVRTEQTTILTTDLNQLHLSMILHLKQLSGTSIQPKEITQLLIKCFVMIQEYCTATAVCWDERAANPVCCSKPAFTIMLDVLTHFPNRTRHQEL